MNHYSHVLNSLLKKGFQEIKALLIIQLLCVGSLYAQIPSGYYNGTSGLSGSSLKAELNDIIKGHITYPYSSSGTDVWDILKVADRDPNNASKVIGIYSNFSMNASAEYNNGNGWNREHVWAKSRGNLGTSQGAGTDLHHIRAADISTNSARNNRNFDYADIFYVDQSGFYAGATSSKTSATDWVWEPRDEVKGDIARMIFYMATRYEGENNEPDLELTEQLLSNSNLAPLHGRLSVLLSWHQNDPVSQSERDRNDIIYSYQNNRNPFIDHPEFVCAIYGCSNTPPNGGGTSNELFISEYIEGSSYNKAIEIANFTGASVNLSNYSIRKQSNGSGSWSTFNLSGSLSNSEVYVVANSSASYSITSNADYITNSSSLSFNGNDPVALFKGSTLVDIVGTYNGGSSYFAKDVTMVRKPSVSSPNTTYTTNEWDFKGKNVFYFIGSHTINGGTKSEFIALSDEYADTFEELEVYPNPVSHQMNYLIDATVQRIQIIDLQGRVQSAITDIENKFIDVSMLNSGVYMLVMETNHGMKSTQFIKH